MYKEKTILTDIKRRIQTIVIPYFSFGLLVLLYWQVIERRFRDSDMSFMDSLVSASKEGVVHNRSFFVILTTDSFEALFISYFKPAGIR